MAKKKKHHRKAIVKYKTRSRPHKRHHRRRRGGGGGGISITHALIAGAVVGYALKQAAVTDLVNKVPGVKTFGAAAGVAAIGLGVDHFVWRNKWVRLIGVGGAVVAAYTMGQNEFKMPAWVGDGDDIGDADDGLLVGDLDGDDD